MATTADLTPAQSLVWNDLDVYEDDPILTLDHLYDIVDNTMVLPDENPGPGAVRIITEYGDELGDAYVTILKEARARKG